MTILNRTKSPRDRYRLMSGPQGNAGYPPDSPNHRYHVVSGVDRGNGYQGYYSVTYFLNECGWGPKEAKAALRRLLGIKSEG